MRRIGYTEGSSLAHRLDPTTKIVVLLALCVVAILAATLVLMAATLLLCLVLVWGSGLGLIMSLRKMRVILLLVTILFLFQVVFTRSGRPIVALGTSIGGWQISMTLTSGGVAAGARIGSRLLIIVLASLFFVGTTDPSLLAYSLMKRGLPYRYGFMLVLALRFVPIFQIEATTVRRAQVARGLGVDVGGPRRIIRLARHTFVPLLVSALGRVGTISVSMDARAFGVGKKRSFLRDVRFSHLDWTVSSLALGLAILSLLLVG